VGLRIKICGITSTRDAVAAVEAGADAIGLNFVGGPRQIDVPRARSILQVVPPMVTPVALARLEDGIIPDALVELLAEYWVSHVQVYGHATAEVLTAFARDGLRPIPVVSVADARFAEHTPEWLEADESVRPLAVLLDTHDRDKSGGTGRTFHWEWVSAARSGGQLDGWPRLILAGGLNPDNVSKAVRQVRPYAVDVSSGVEAEGVPGQKDAGRMRAFVQAAREAGRGIAE
jgi:phosphoribosylanthranilate isomerase